MTRAKRKAPSNPPESPSEGISDAEGIQGVSREESSRDSLCGLENDEGEFSPGTSAYALDCLGVEVPPVPPTGIPRSDRSGKFRAPDPRYDRATVLLGLYAGKSVTQVLKACGSSWFEHAMQIRGDKAWAGAVERAQECGIDALEDLVTDEDTHMRLGRSANSWSRAVLRKLEARRPELYGKTLNINHTHDINLTASLEGIQARKARLLEQADEVSAELPAVDAELIEDSSDEEGD